MTSKPLQTRSRVVKPPAKQTAPVTTTSIPVAQFLTNLRLLDLDLLPDWPDITSANFSSTSANAAQGHKKRLKCVEWALYRLFEIWDPEETAAKLSPNFPPNDQLQSVNLRAALLRALETAKKNGALGRDTIIRKTMLDECKGERFEELLSSFSSTVLKRAAGDRIDEGQESISPAVAMALENFDYKSDITAVKSLVLAYRVSLSHGLTRRKAASAKYVDFDELLAIKDRGIARRREAVQAKPRKEEGVTPGTLRTVRNNWTGNEAWMDTLLYGDGSASGGNQGLFSVPFDKVWRRVQQGRLADAENDGQGLLDQLDMRVKAQQKRLTELDVFRKHMASDRAQASPLLKRTAEPEKRGIDLRFEAHKTLQVDNMVRSINAASAEWDPEYQVIVQELHGELREIKAANAHNVLGPLLKRKKRESFLQPTTEDYPEEEPISELSELEEEEPQPQTRAFESNMKSSKRLPRPFAPQVRNLSTERIAMNIDTNMSDTNSVDSATDSLADLSLGNGQRKTPSPTKSSKSRHTLSLAERTRLSMVGSRFLDDEPELPSESSTSKNVTPMPLPAESPREEDELAEGGYEDLLSRTRKSMAGFEKAQQKAHLDRRRSLRKSKMLPPRHEGSLFPAVAEEKEQDYGAMIDKLMAEDNMDAIFKSRPKIRASPIPPEWDDE